MVFDAVAVAISGPPVRPFVAQLRTVQARGDEDQDLVPRNARFFQRWQDLPQQQLDSAPAA